MTRRTCNATTNTVYSQLLVIFPHKMSRLMFAALLLLNGNSKASQSRYWDSKEHEMLWYKMPAPL